MPSAGDIAKVKDRLSIVDVIGARVALKQSGREHVGLCPFHSERTPSFTVSAERQLFHCFGCGFGGDVFTFAERIDGLDFAATLAQLAGLAGVTLEAARPLSSRDRARQARARLSLTPARPAPPRQPAPLEPCRPDLAELLAAWQAALPGSPGEAYLAGRGIPLELAQAHGCGYAAGTWPSPNAGARVVIPHTRPDGVAVNAYGRAIGAGSPGERDFPDISAAHKRADGPGHLHLAGRRGLFNAPALATPDAQPVYLTEAPIDALALMAAGYGSAVALFGTHGLPWEWLPASVRLVLALDNDGPGRTGAADLLAEASRRGRTFAALSPDAYGGRKDAAEAWCAGILAPPPMRIPVRETLPLTRANPAPDPRSREYENAPKHLPAAGSRDPRPDLLEDAALWAELLEVSHTLGDPDSPVGVHGAILAARCIGARLQLAGDTLRLLPGEDAEAYADLRERYLRPHLAHLVALLRKAAYSAGARMAG